MNDKALYGQKKYLKTNLYILGDIMREIIKIFVTDEEKRDIEENTNRYARLEISECNIEALNKKYEQIMKRQKLEWKKYVLYYGSCIRMYTLILIYPKW